MTLRNAQQWRFERLLAEALRRRHAVERAVTAQFPERPSHWVDDAVAQAFGELPGHRDAFVARARREDREPTARDVEFLWRRLAALRVHDRLDAELGRHQHPNDRRAFVALDEVAEAAQHVDFHAESDLVRDPWLARWEELLLTLSDEERRYARIRFVEMEGPDGLSMREAMTRLGWSQGRWNTTGRRVKDKLADAAAELVSGAWCARHQQRLEPWLAGVLTPEQSERMRVHLDGCEDCLDASIRVGAQLRSTAHRLLAPAPLAGASLLMFLKHKLAHAARAGGIPAKVTTSLAVAGAVTATVAVHAPRTPADTAGRLSPVARVAQSGVPTQARRPAAAVSARPVAKPSTPHRHPAGRSVRSATGAPKRPSPTVQSAPSADRALGIRSAPAPAPTPASVADRALGP